MALILISLLIGAFAGAQVFLGLPRGARILGAIAAFLTMAWATWGAAPTLAHDFYALPVLLFFCGLLGVGAAMLGMEQGGRDSKALHGSVFTSLFCFGWILLLSVSSWGMFRADAYRNVIQVEEKPLDATVELIDQSHARLVDQPLALRRATELLGTQKGLGSSYTVGTPVVQTVQGRQVWVAPLEPATIWAWLQNPGAPGYVVVSATNYSDAQIHLNHTLRYSMSAWFGKNVETAMYNAAPTQGRTDFSFELDEAGRPYWVATTYENTVSASAPRANGVQVLDAETGASQWYAVGSEPAWIDRVQPEAMVAEQLDLWGDYVHGYWNFSREDIVHVTPGMSLVHLKDGRSAWFSGILNARSEASNAAATNGFVLVDTKTGKATVHYQQGISESAAMQVLEGAVQQTRYTANFPIAYLVHGSLTYVSVLKDAAGNSRMVGMVSALDRSVVAVGDNLEHVTRVYLSALRGSSVRTAALAPEAAPRTVSGTLVRSGSYVLEGRSFVLVRLQVGEATRDYTVDIGPASLRQIVLAQPGDGVELQVLASDAGGDEIRAVTVTPKP